MFRFAESLTEVRLIEEEADDATLHPTLFIALILGSIFLVILIWRYWRVKYLEILENGILE